MFESRGLFMVLMTLFCWACSGDSTEAPLDAPNVPVTEETVDSKPSWDGITCDGGILPHYQRLIKNGCQLKTTPGDLAMTYRVLRNAGFAAMGRKFKSPELTAVYGSEVFCSGPGSSNYTPQHDEVTLDADEEKTCIAKLKAREKELRAGNQPPKSLEVYVLTNEAGSVELEARRVAGLDVMGSHASVSHTPPGDGPGSWQIHFYSEWMEGEGDEAFKAESATIIICDEAGENCSTQMAG